MARKLGSWGMEAAAAIIIALGPAWMTMAATAGAMAAADGRWDDAARCWMALACPILTRSSARAPAAA